MRIPEMAFWALGVEWNREDGMALNPLFRGFSECIWLGEMFSVRITLQSVGEERVLKGLKWQWHTPLL